MLSVKIKNDARSVAYGLYRRNALSARGYAFSANSKEVTCGEFAFRFNDLQGYDYYLRFSDRRFFRANKIRADSF